MVGTVAAAAQDAAHARKEAERRFERQQKRDRDELRAAQKQLQQSAQALEKLNKDLPAAEMLLPQLMNVSAVFAVCDALLKGECDLRLQICACVCLHVCLSVASRGIVCCTERVA